MGDEENETPISVKPLILPSGTSSKSVTLDGDLSSKAEIKSTHKADAESAERKKLNAYRRKKIGTAREKPTRRFGGKP